jgi:phage terminase Nu1 subunit (DNA packaging protein)
MSVAGEKVLASATAVSVTVISRLLMITDRRVQQLAKDGIIPKGENRRYNLEEVVQAYIQYLQGKNVGRGLEDDNAIDFHTEKARLTKVQADKAELEYKQACGELVRAEDVSKNWYDMINDCKNRLLSVPSRAAPIVSSESNAGMCQQIIDDLIRESLEELSEVAHGVAESGDNTNEGDAGVEATTKANG